MITLQAGQLENLLTQLFWPFVRIGACFMVAPIFSAQFIPARVKVLLALAVAVLVAPLVPTPSGIAPFSAM